MLRYPLTTGMPRFENFPAVLQRSLTGAVPGGNKIGLPDVVDQVSGRIAVLMDGGILRGSDVVKALAMGASAVLVGRAPLWGVAAAGQAGAARALSILGEETARVMGLLGCAAVRELGRALLWSDFAVKEKPRWQ